MQVTRKDGRSKRLVPVKFEDTPTESTKIYWKDIYPYDVVKIGKVPGIFWADNIKLLLQVFL